jgi:type IX secretion system PorP/SprF family membrane protein
MKRISGFFFIIFYIYTVHAQQDPQFSQSMYSIMMYNPGYMGSKNAICATAFNRQQWKGMEGAPATSVFAANTPFRLLGADHGAGLHILSDRTGSANNLGINVSYAYRMDVGAGKLGIGAGFGMINSSLDAVWEIPSGTGSGSGPVPAGNENTMIRDFSAGLFYYAENMYAGISSTHLNEPSIEYNAAATSFLARHYYFTAGCTFNLENQSYSVHPVVKAHSDGVITQLNLGALVNYSERFWGGLSYRFGAAVTGIAGIELYNGIRVGYSYDMSTTAIGNYSRGTHEFMLRYCFDLGTERRPQRYRSIRIL